MAPWPDRAASINRPSASDFTPRASFSRPNAAANRFANTSSRMTEFEVLDSSQIHVSSSSDDDQLRASTPARPRHARSMSHPFPSLFSSKKKKQQQQGRPAAGKSDSESADEDAHMSKLKGKSNPPRAHRHGPSSGSRDFATGHCMTCGSSVRWPKELHVFKCTICLTINDLQPAPVDERRDSARASTDTHAAGQRQRLPSNSKIVVLLCLAACTITDLLIVPRLLKKRIQYLSSTLVLLSLNVCNHFCGAPSPRLRTMKLPTILGWSEELRSQLFQLLTAVLKAHHLLSPSTLVQSQQNRIHLYRDLSLIRLQIQIFSHTLHAAMDPFPDHTRLLIPKGDPFFLT
jgi:hypothetical protein